MPINRNVKANSVNEDCTVTFLQSVFSAIHNTKEECFQTGNTPLDCVIKILSDSDIS